MSAIRVVHVGCVLDVARRGGAELLAAWPTLGDVAAAVRASGADVSVVQAAHRDERLTLAGVEYHFVTEARLARPAGDRRPGAVLPFRLARAVAALTPDVIHVNGLAFPLHLRALTRAAPRAAMLVQDHADRPPRRLRWLARRAFRVVDGVSFTAREQAEPFLEAGILRAGTRIFEVPESSTHFRPGDRAAAGAALGIHGDPAVLWVGHLDANKDPLTILDAVALALESLPGLHLWCCFGKAPLMGAVRARLAADPALAERVHLLGTLLHAQVELACRAADFLLSGSRRESSGYAVIEALACGVTPIAADIPAFRALLGRGAIGALAPCGDAQAFAAHLVNLARSDRDYLRRRARAHFERVLAFPVIGARLAAAYRELIDTRRAA